jgi:hypothetical protein
MNNKKLTRKEKVEISQLKKKFEKAKSDKKLGIGFSIGGLIFILFFGNIWLNRNHEILKTELITIEGTVTNKLELKWRRRVGHSMTIQIKEYPNIDFRIGRFGTQALKSYQIRDKVEIGDKIQIDTKRKEYENLNPSSNNRKVIDVYGVRDNEVEYLNVNGYNREFSKDRNSISMYLILGFSFWMLGYGIYLITKNRKKPATNKG